MSLYKNIKSKKEKVSVIGLGYVGMPLAIAFAKKVNVIGYDINSEKESVYSHSWERVGINMWKGFFVGYSPERINPGDKIHRIETIKKIVSGINKETLEEIANIYGLIIEAGVYRVSSIKVAEAEKVVANSQRDINIAFMNKLVMAFDKMGIDTGEVVVATNTKWNALCFIQV